MSRALLIGYAFEMIGVFLLAVEAIKLDNLVILRTKIRKLASALNPVIKIVDEDTPETRDSERLLLAELALLGSIGGASIVIPLAWFGHNPLGFWNIQLDSEFYTWCLRIFGTAFALWACFAVGVLLYGLVLKSLDWTVKWMTWIEQNTANGLVGVMGFVSYAIYMLLKVLSSH